MIENIKFIVKKKGLYLCFDSLIAKQYFLQEMHLNNIGMFIDEDKAKLYCFTQIYTHANPSGQFISQEQRVGLVFSSKKHKFIFKDVAGLGSEQFMDMGPGYDAQLHFNESVLPSIDGASTFTKMMLPDIKEGFSNAF